MARPKKTTVDYFPHYVHHGKILYILEANYRNDGYAFFYKLLELLADSEGHYYNCSTAPAWKFLTAKTLVSEVSATEILDTLAEMEIIDKILWSKRIIWMQSFVESISVVYAKRVVSAPEMPVSAPEIRVSDDGSTQSKVKETKVNITKVISPHHLFGEYKHIKLTDEEYKKLLVKFNGDCDRMIQNLDTGIELKGYKYKNHYLAVLKWAEKDAADGYNNKPTGTTKLFIDKARACFLKSNGNCAATWDKYSAAMDNQCHYCDKFKTIRGDYDHR